MKHVKTESRRCRKVRRKEKIIARIIITTLIVAIFSAMLVWPMALSNTSSTAVNATIAESTADEATAPSTEAPTQRPTQRPMPPKPTRPPTEAPTEAPTEPPTEPPTEAPTEPITEEPQVVEEEEYEEDSYEEESYDDVEVPEWNGAVLTASAGRIQGPSGEETYYNLPMDGVISIMRSCGYDYEYWVRDDGVKMYGDYVMCAANLDLRPRGSLIQTSLGMGIVCDTGGFAYSNPTQLDIAVTW